MADLEMTPDMEHEDLAGWVLGILDPEESERFQAHLETCSECREMAAELTPAAELLKSSGPDTDLPADVDPPADLEPRTLVRVGQASGKSFWRRQRGRLTSVAAAAVVAVGAGTAVTLLQSAPASAFTIPMHAPGGSTASGQAVAHHTASGWSIQMTVHGLQRLRAGHFYECWYASPTDRPGRRDLITAGTFTVDSSGSATMQMWSAADPREYPTMQITAENSGDATQHGKVVLSGTARA